MTDAPVPALHITRVAYGCDSLRALQQRLAMRIADGVVHLTTRYRPKRHEEIAGGSIYWIIAHQVVARSRILGFTDSPDGRTDILVEPIARPVRIKAKRAHQGWRYLEDKDAPADLGEGELDDSAILPSKIARELNNLGLV